jgi:hypothetical protein
VFFLIHGCLAFQWLVIWREAEETMSSFTTVMPEDMRCSLSRRPWTAVRITALVRSPMGKERLSLMPYFITDRKAAILAAVQGGFRRWGINFSSRPTFSLVNGGEFRLHRSWQTSL